MKIATFYDPIKKDKGCDFRMAVVMRRVSENVGRRNHFRAVRTVVMVALVIVTLSCIGYNRIQNISTSDNQHGSWKFLPEHDLSHRDIIKRVEKTAVVRSETLGFGEPVSGLNDDHRAELTTRSSNYIETIPDGAMRRLFGVSQEAKKEALKGLEKPLLEPPRRALSKSSAFLKKIKYLPDLLHDHTLDRYHRLVFVTSGTDEQNQRSEQWFYENYPTRNQHFEVFAIESCNIDVSGWLLENVGEGDYVVLKAEAGAVEEMMVMKSDAIGLLDELFLECKNQWGFKERNKSKRAYWECLSLYGRLKDEGIAVHQWWE